MELTANRNGVLLIAFDQVGPTVVSFRKVGSVWPAKTAEHWRGNRNPRPEIYFKHDCSFMGNQRHTRMGEGLAKHPGHDTDAKGLLANPTVSEQGRKP